MKRHIMLASSLLIILFGMGTFSGQVHGNAIHVEATQALTITPSVTHLALNYSYVGTIDVGILLENNSQPIAGGYFTLVGIPYDIGEAQSDLGNGSYILQFSSGHTQLVAPGNYSSQLSVTINGKQASIAFPISITTTDHAAPKVTISQPLNLNNVTDSRFKLTLTATDDTQWHDLNVSLGRKPIFYELYTATHINTPRLNYTATTLYFSDWIDLIALGGGSSNNIYVTVRDQSFNANVSEISLHGDYLKPILSWVSPSQDQHVYDRTITLKWTVQDNSSIKSQQITLNGDMLVPELKSITSAQREVTMDLQIPQDQPMVLTFKLVVYDIYNNRAETSLTLIYDTSKDTTSQPNPIIPGEVGQELQSFGEAHPLAMILMFVLLGFGVIGIPIVYFYFRKDGTTESVTKAGVVHNQLSKGVRKLIASPPTDSIKEKWYGKVIDGSPENATIVFEEFLISSITEIQGSNSSAELQNAINMCKYNFEELTRKTEVEELQKEGTRGELYQWLDQIQKQLKELK